MRLAMNAAAWLAMGPALLLGQSGTGTIRGLVTDPSGRVVPGAAVAVSRGAGSARTARSDIQGRYEIERLDPGVYTVRVTAGGFAPFEAVKVDIAGGRVAVLDVALKLAATTEKITVQDAAKRVDTDPANNAGALVLRGKDLEALASDRDDLAADLQALAGPAAGPSGGQIYIDGFTGGRLPPKASIREVRINQNPFSAQYDKLGYGRIEVFTKPGSEEFHGELVFFYGHDAFNSRNPFVAHKPPYERRQWEGELTGPWGKQTTLSGDFEIRRMSEDAFVRAITLGPNLEQVNVAEGVVTPARSTEENIKVDRQLTPNHSLVASYMYARDSRDNQGVGGFSLAGRAFRNRDAEDEFRFGETGILGPRGVNETRARYQRLRSEQTGNANQPTITVLEAFTGGGAPLTRSFTNQDRFEVSNLTVWTRAAHALRWGGRVRAVALRDRDTQNYTGTFTFSSLDSFRITKLGLAQGQSPAGIRAAGGGASQFSLAAGDPLASLRQADVGLFAQDDWRIRERLTASFGLRYEGQNHVSRHRDVAPRLGLALGLGKSRKTVLRAGAGMFFDRVSENLALAALRRDGIHQLQFVTDAPDFYPVVPTVAQLTGARARQAVRRVAADLHAPRLLQAAAGIERQLPKGVTVSANFVRTDGVHQLRSRSLAAAAGDATAIYLYESSGQFRQKQLITSVNAKVSSEFSLAGSYTFGKAMSDTDGAGTFPADSGNLKPEYGRAGFDTRHRAQLSGAVTVPSGVRLSPLLVATSGRLFNITLGRDVNGDTLFTDRPAFAADAGRAGVVRTAYGLFSLAPAPGGPVIPRNYGAGPAQFALNLRAARGFPLGAKGKPSEREIVVSVYARNVLNHPNLALPVGNLSSPLFGQSTAVEGFGRSAAAGNRRVELQVRFTF